ncbi:30S ribosomal protein S17 [Candidatus Saccharibacteria bacterium]|nr:MAG: 30S ribosomal protein S17 [Candidatus Saccharibacteria bacterium]
MAKKVITGIVTSDSRDKTITVTVTSRETHPLYGKQYTVNRKYQAHDPKNDAHNGDKVSIVECTPISKTKSFELKEVIERSKGSIKLKDEVTKDVEDKVDHDAKDEEDEE